MRIILEGPDNAGKTTFAHELLKLHPLITYFHPGGKPNDVEAEGVCVEQQLNWLENHSPILMDRCTPISQRVYNPDPELDQWRDHMWQRYVKIGVVVIYCRPSTDRLLRVQDLTWRDDETEEHKQKIIKGQHSFIERYDALMQTIPNVCYDFEDRAHAEVLLKKTAQALTGSVEASRWFDNIINLRG